MNNSSPAVFPAEIPTRAQRRSYLLNPNDEIAITPRWDERLCQRKRSTLNRSMMPCSLRVFCRTCTLLKSPGYRIGTDRRKTETEEKDTNLTLILTTSVSDALIRWKRNVLFAYSHLQTELLGFLSESENGVFSYQTGVSVSRINIAHSRSRTLQVDFSNNNRHFDALVVLKEILYIYIR